MAKFAHEYFVDFKDCASPPPYIMQPPVSGFNSCLQAVVFKNIVDN